MTPEFLGPEYEIPLQNFFPSSREFFSRGRSEKKGEEGKASERPLFSFRIAWQKEGILLSTSIDGKKKPVQCDPVRTETSDALHFLFDTRDVRDIHRASRFCHRFLFLPTDSIKSSVPGKPVAFWLPIHRAKAHPNPVDVTKFLLASELWKEGWRLSAFLPSGTLTGYDPIEHPRTGFWFSLFDNEFGWFNLQLSGLFPAEEDPSLWSTLEFV